MSWRTITSTRGGDSEAGSTKSLTKTTALCRAKSLSTEFSSMNPRRSTRQGSHVNEDKKVTFRGYCLCPNRAAVPMTKNNDEMSRFYAFSQSKTSTSLPTAENCA